jgi:hypothetical protein
MVDRKSAPDRGLDGLPVDPHPLTLKGHPFLEGHRSMDVERTNEGNVVSRRLGLCGSIRLCHGLIGGNFRLPTVRVGPYRCETQARRGVRAGWPSR